jgi:hypothetical protein
MSDLNGDYTMKIRSDDGQVHQFSSSASYDIDTKRCTWIAYAANDQDRWKERAITNGKAMSGLWTELRDARSRVAVRVSADKEFDFVFDIDRKSDEHNKKYEKALGEFDRACGARSNHLLATPS